MDLEKLMMSKAIMDRHNTMSRGQGGSSHMLENFDAPQARYNINPDLLSENTPQSPQMPVSAPNMSNQMGFPKASADAIRKSKLPDEIKKLMMEHPIEQPGMRTGPTLSNELVEKASKLMGTKKPTQTQRENISESNVTNTNLREMMKDVVREVLRENGMITESVEKTNDRFTFQVGKHIFEGKLTKVKKLS